MAWIGRINGAVCAAAFGLGVALLAAVPGLAQTVDTVTVPDTECDRMAGFWQMPRIPGGAMAYQVTDPAGAVSACDRARDDHPDERFFDLLLVRALLSESDESLRVLPLLQGARASYPALALYQLGYLQDYGVAGLTPDESEARRLFAAACDLAPQQGAYAACVQLSLMQIEGRGGAPDAARGLERLDALCSGDWPLACVERMLIGEIYAADSAQDQTALLATGCAGQDLFACSLLGQRHQEGDGAPRDMDRARALYARACDGGDAYGCANLGETYRAGLGVAPDIARAVALFSQACTGQDTFACVTLGDILENAQGVPRDTEGALAAYDTACLLGDPEACDRADGLRP